MQQFKPVKKCPLTFELICLMYVYMNYKLLLFGICTCILLNCFTCTKNEKSVCFYSCLQNALCPLASKLGRKFQLQRIQMEEMEVKTY